MIFKKARRGNKRNMKQGGRTKEKAFKSKYVSSYIKKDKILLSTVKASKGEIETASELMRLVQ